MNHLPSMKEPKKFEGWESVFNYSLNVDWRLLAKQKSYLLRLINEGENKSLTEEQVDLLMGVVCFIDSFQDWSIDVGNATEDEVLPTLLD